MSYKGIVKNGVVVLPPGAKLPEGAEVDVIPTSDDRKSDPFLAAVEKVAKPRPHWPKDYSRNLDHYLYRVRKKS